MADLPDVVLWKVFDFLPISERLRVRSTCKTWKFVIETYNSPQSLCIYSIKYPGNERWCFSNKKVTEDEMVYLKYRPDLSCRFCLRQEFFRNLQSVYLYAIKKKVGPFLQEMHYLTRLKMLKVDREITKPTVLSSFSLEKLSLKARCEIELNTPNLNSLALWMNSEQSGKTVNFRFPSKLKHLECIKFTSNLSQLKNLETLVCQEVTPDFRLNDVECLTRLEIWPTEQQLPMVMRIQEERTRLKRNELELIVSGFSEELVSCERNNYPGNLWLTPAYLEQIKRNRPKFVGVAPWYACLDIETLLRHPDRVPNELFKHFPNLDYTHWIPADRLPSRLEDLGISESRLIETIQISNPQRLDIKVPELTQGFYNQLGRLESVKVLNLRIDLKIFDFDCLLNLKNLVIVGIQYETFPIEFVCKLVKNLRFFFNSNFYTFGCPIVLLIAFERRPENLIPGALNRHFHINLYDSGTTQFFFTKSCKDVDELVGEIRSLERNKLLQQYLQYFA